ncbi:3-oxoacid CoA-transferase subunit B [Babesia caballi]|uniref:3-oxoacid CoA-transferase subunit B n=1 Tax=Babesia caballi TaxID=5871 RepID=A0AAV4M0Z0_BABCB|nr:3-oxoacid CoA-transferase subunit B [Babesia caballi]
MLDYITVLILLLLTTALSENNATLSRQKGAHKSAKASEVKAVGATAQGSEARVPGEGGCGGAGGLDTVEGVSDIVVTKEVERCEGVGVPTLISFKALPLGVGFVGGCAGILENAGILFDKRLETVGQIANKRF